MERLEAEKRILQEKLDQPVSAPMSPRNLVSTSSLSSSSNINSNPPGSMASSNTQHLILGHAVHHSFPASSEQAANLTEHIINLRREVTRLKTNLEKAERDHKENMAKLAREEKVMRDENVRLQRRLQMEVDRREALCRHLSESESSLEMDDERHFNETTRVRTVSSPVPGYLVQSNQSLSSNTASNNQTTQVSSSNSTFPVPLLNQLHSSAANLISMQQPQTNERCPTCNQVRVPGFVNKSATSPPSFAMNQVTNNKQQQSIIPIGSNFTVVNSLTASSSLSSSSSSINSTNVNKMQQQQQTLPTNIFSDKK